MCGDISQLYTIVTAMKKDQISKIVADRQKSIRYKTPHMFVTFLKHFEIDLLLELIPSKIYTSNAESNNLNSFDLNFFLANQMIWPKVEQNFINLQKCSGKYFFFSLFYSVSCKKIQMILKIQQMLSYFLMGSEKIVNSHFSIEYYIKEAAVDRCVVVSV